MVQPIPILINSSIIKLIIIDVITCPDFIESPKHKISTYDGITYTDNIENTSSPKYKNSTNDGITCTKNIEETSSRKDENSNYDGIAYPTANKRKILSSDDECPRSPILFDDNNHFICSDDEGDNNIKISLSKVKSEESNTKKSPVRKKWEFTNKIRKNKRAKFVCKRCKKLHKKCEISWGNTSCKNCYGKYKCSWNE